MALGIDDVFLSLFLAVAARSGAPPTPTELVCDVKTCVAGRPFTVALHMSLPKGWHNYYSNPGESGMPTMIKWTLPPGFKAGPIQWPLPKLVVVDTIKDLVYEGDEWLLTTITPPKKLQPGPIVIGAKAEWLLCQEACVPQSAQLTLTLRSGRHVAVDHAAEKRIETARLAAPNRKPTFTISARMAGKQVVMTAKVQSLDAREATFFPADPDFFSADMPVATYQRGVLSVEIPLSKYADKKPARLTGILSFPGNSKAFWVDVPVS